MNRLYKCKNKAGNNILIVAPSEDDAAIICKKIGHVKDISSIKTEDITNDYVAIHSYRGFVMPSATGQLFQEINGSKSIWSIWKVI